MRFKPGRGGLRSWSGAGAHGPNTSESPQRAPLPNPRPTIERPTQALVPTSRPGSRRHASFGTLHVTDARAQPIMTEWLVIIVIALIVFGPLLLKARKKSGRTEG